MNTKRLRRLEKEAKKLAAHHDEALEEIAEDLRIMTGHKGLIVVALAGDGYGVNVDLNGNTDCASLAEVIAIIEKKGTVTAQEILDMPQI